MIKHAIVELSNGFFGNVGNGLFDKLINHAIKIYHRKSAPLIFLWMAMMYPAPRVKRGSKIVSFEGRVTTYGNELINGWP